ncbi:MAG: tetratricopeptide repeat protein [Planctomycetota bacterium]
MGVRIRSALPLVVLVLTTSVAYRGSFSVPFQFDDYPAILENEWAQDPSEVGRIWSEFPQRFVVFWSLAGNYGVSGTNVVSYHIVNFAIHLTASIAVYLFLIQFWRAVSSGTSERRPSEELGALAGALLFALHPVQTQAVTYIWQRGTALVALFCVLALIFHLRAIERQRRGERSWTLLTSSLFFALLAFHTKESAFALPVIVGALEWVLRDPMERWNVVAKRLAPWGAALFVLPILLWTMGDPAIEHMQTLGELGPAEYFATQLRVLLTYVRIVVWPAGLNLDHDYPYATSLLAWGSVWRFALLSTIGLGALWIGRRRPVFSFSVLVFFLAQATESSFLPLADVIFEHRLYFPMVGVCLLFATAVKFACEQPGWGVSMTSRPWLTLCVLCCTFVPLVVLTSSRNEVWASQVSLWEDVVEKSPRKSRAWDNLGVAYLREGRPEDARRAYERAIALDPSHPEMLNKLGVVYRNLGDVNRAIACFLQAFWLNPEAENAAAKNLVNLHLERGKPDTAREALARALEKRPGDPGLLAFLVHTYVASDDEAGAQEAILQLLAEPRGTASVQALATQLMKDGDYRLAEFGFESILDPAAKTGGARVDPVQIRGALALAKYCLGKTAEVEEQLALCAELGLHLNVESLERLKAKLDRAP